MLGDPEAAKEEGTEEQDEQRASNESPFFCEDGKDRVAHRFGEKVELVDALSESPAEDMSRTDCDERLLDLIAGSLRIARRVNEREDAAFDVWNRERKDGDNGDAREPDG